ncbi:MAG TPA: SDR family NAD(P)-dependent oxidoreductase [Anaerolineaceae bacterium]|nr:SDR family NAD(P)-dependent oxidoreductase [Anaerolineaceae bacterium]
MLLENKISIITGAANGIGRGIALRFAREGSRVGILDLSAEACEAVAEEIRSCGGQAAALPANVADAGQVHAAFQKTMETFGIPTVLVHNAAVMPNGTVAECSEKEWDLTFSVVARGAYLTSHQAIPLMRQAGGGVILFMASITGVVGLPGLAAYSASKGALISLARAMAIDHAREGIRVNTVSPGTIDSPMLHRFVASQKDPEATLQAFHEMFPRGKLGTIEEVASVFAFLASDEASFVSGTNVMVDGAMSVKSEQPRL